MASPDDAALGFSIVSSQVPLRIVGIVDADAVTSGGGGFGRAGAYVPVAVAQTMGVVQGNDMSEIVRDSTTGGERGPLRKSDRARGRSPRTFPPSKAPCKQMGYIAVSRCTT